MKETEITREIFLSVLANTRLKNIRSNAALNFANEIEAKRFWVTDAEFPNFLENEKAKLLADDRLEQYLKLKGIGMSSHDNAAILVAHTIEEQEKHPIDWGKCWRSLFKPDFVERMGLFFLEQYIEGLKLEGKLDAIRRYQKKMAAAAVSVPGVELRPAYIGLFVGEEAAHKALKAAMTAGIIDETGKEKLGKKIVSAIVQFWEAVSDPKLKLTHKRALKESPGETYRSQCEAIAEQFGTTIGKTAIYDHAGKRSGKYFTDVTRALGGT